MKRSLLDYTLDETADLERFVGVPFGEILGALTTSQSQSVVTLKAEWWGLARQVEPDLTVEEATRRVAGMSLMDMIKAIQDLAVQVKEPDDGDADAG